MSTIPIQPAEKTALYPVHCPVGDHLWWTVNLELRGAEKRCAVHANEESGVVMSHCPVGNHDWLSEGEIPTSDVCPEHEYYPRPPRLGEMVLYKITEGDAVAQNKRRKDAQESLAYHRRVELGTVIHVGNALREGDIYPMLITRVWGATEKASVNGQVFLDGTDVLWVTSVAAADFHEFPPRSFVYRS